MLPQFSLTRLIAWADTLPHKQSLPYRAVHAFCRIFFITIQEYRKNELSLRAAALTYTVMLSLVPILAMSTAVVKGLGGGDQLKKAVYSYVSTLEQDRQTPAYIPESDVQQKSDSPDKIDEQQSSLTQHLYAALDKLFDYVDRTNFTTLGTFGVVGIVLSVVLVLGNIEMAMNAIWNVESGRSVMRKISDYLALIVLMPLSVNVGLAANAVLMNKKLLAKFTILMPVVWFQALILKFIPIFFLALTLCVIYLFFPNTKVKTIPAMIGALFAGFCWFEVQNLYISLQIGVSKYNAIYGSFATLPLFLIWIYCGWVFILLGAQIAYACQKSDILRLTDTSTPPSLQLAVAFDILDYVHNRFDEEREATLADFCQKFPIHEIDLVEKTMELLKKSNLLHLATDNVTIRPSLPRAKLNSHKIIRAVLGESFSDTDGGRKSCKALEAAATPSLLITNDQKTKEEP